MAQYSETKNLTIKYVVFDFFRRYFFYKQKYYLLNMLAQPQTLIELCVAQIKQHSTQHILLNIETLHLSEDISWEQDV